MQDGGLFQDTEQVKKITPYEKLRKLRGWSQEKCAEVFATNKHAIIDIEMGRRDPSKQMIRMMDRVYNCNGKLIEYWLPRFSLAPVKEYGVLERIWLWIKQWMTL